MKNIKNKFIFTVCFMLTAVINSADQQQFGQLVEYLKSTQETDIHRFSKDFDYAVQVHEEPILNSDLFAESSDVIIEKNWHNDGFTIKKVSKKLSDDKKYIVITTENFTTKNNSYMTWENGQRLAAVMLVLGSSGILLKEFKQNESIAGLLLGLIGGSTVGAPLSGAIVGGYLGYQLDHDAQELYQQELKLKKDLEATKNEKSWFSVKFIDRNNLE